MGFYRGFHPLQNDRYMTNHNLSSILTQTTQLFISYRIDCFILMLYTVKDFMRNML
jgi:hypothetical protein